MDLVLIDLLESSKAIGLCPMGKYKIVVPLFGAAYAAPKGTTIYTDLGLQKQC